MSITEALNMRYLVLVKPPCISHSYSAVNFAQPLYIAVSKCPFQGMSQRIIRIVSS